MRDLEQPIKLARSQSFHGWLVLVRGPQAPVWRIQLVASWEHGMDRQYYSGAQALLALGAAVAVHIAGAAQSLPVPVAAGVTVAPRDPLPLPSFDTRPARRAILSKVPML